jgi:lipopolysaccharide/colanic/teichoic acid biosynthesis glycosyltransferase
VYRQYIKAILDRLFALILLLVLSPLLLCLSVIVRIIVGRPVFFVQERVGQGEKRFFLFKFRSMTTERDPNGVLLEDSQRLTAFGLFLRASSLDELPELFNILMGHMSFVGPRPLPCKYLPRYNDEQRRRHDVKPGLTGCAQVMGRNLLSWEERFNYDIHYVDHLSFAFDMEIIFKTFGIVLGRKGISSESHATMEEFMGSGNDD